MKKRRKLRSGFTMVELIVVILIVAILGAVAVPSILSFIESGRQTNRMDVARSLYLGAQNQLTELRVTRGLDSAINDPLLGGGAISRNTNATKVFHALGFTPANRGNWPDDPANDELVHFISKKAGEPITDYPLMHRLLSTVVVNREVLDNDAILIEFNIETGVVLSVFCSDRFEAGGEFVYTGNSENSIRHEDGAGVRGMGAEGYEPTARSRARRQGYYGVDNTGQLPNLGYPIVSLHDGANVPLSLPTLPAGATPEEISEYNEYNGSSNVLYAPILIPTDMAEEFDIRINGERFATMQRSPGPGRQAPVVVGETVPPTAPGNPHILIEVTAPDAEDYFAYYLILDYLDKGGNKRKDVEDYIVGTFDTVESVNVGVRLRRNGTHATSNDWHPYFDGPADQSGYYGIATGRHLYNIRRAADRPTEQYRGKRFILRRDIDFSEGSPSYVSNFKPIDDSRSPGRGFRGRFEGNRHVIYNLTVNDPGEAGLFAFIDEGGEVNNLTLENPKVESTGSSAGAVSGRNKGTINAAFIRFKSSYNGRPISDRTIKGAITGGIAGENEGDIIDAVFISPLSDEHVLVGGVSSGGIAGRNANGRIKNALFLALAPKDSSSTIVPIATDGAVEHTYFLSGAPERPATVASNRTGYNRETVRGYGRGMTTWQFYSRLNYGADGYTLNDWTKLPDLTEADVATKYPYPFIPIWNSSETALTIIPREVPDAHPLANTSDGITPTRSVAYYEATGEADDLEISLLSYRYSSNIDLPAHDEPIISEGYVLNIAHAAEIKITISGTEYTLRGGPDSGSPTWSWVPNTILTEQGLMLTNTPVLREWEEYDEDEDETITLEGYQLFLDNDVLERLSGGSFIDLFVREGDDDTVISYARFHPMFANTVIDPDTTLSPESSFGTVPNPFIVRSPRHLSNISYINSNSLATPANSNFKQDLDIDFDTYRKAVAVSSAAIRAVDESVMQFPDRAVVTGTFRGSYAGLGHEIRNATAQTAIFSVVGMTGSIESVTLDHITITASSGFGAGTLAGINNGRIQSVNVINSSVIINGAGSFSAGGVAAINNGAMNIINVTETEIATLNGTAGGVTGTNNSAASIIVATVRNCHVTVTRTGVAGGVVGNNVAGITGVPGLEAGGLISTASVTDTETFAGSGSMGEIAASNGGTIN